MDPTKDPPPFRSTPEKVFSEDFIAFKDGSLGSVSSASNYGQIRRRSRYAPVRDDKRMAEELLRMADEELERVRNQILSGPVFSVLHPATSPISPETPLPSIEDDFDQPMSDNLQGCLKSEFSTLKADQDKKVVFQEPFLEERESGQNGYGADLVQGAGSLVGSNTKKRRRQSPGAPEERKVKKQKMD